MTVLSGAGLELDRELRHVTAHGHPVHLTQSEFAILELLMLRRSVVTKEQLIRTLYGSHGEPEWPDNTLKVHIVNLRRQLASAGQPDAIRVVWGIGYVFSGWGCGRPHVRPRQAPSRKPAPPAPLPAPLPAPPPAPLPAHPAATC